MYISIKSICWDGIFFGIHSGKAEPQDAGCHLKPALGRPPGLLTPSGCLDHVSLKHQDFWAPLRWLLSDQPALQEGPVHEKKVFVPTLPSTLISDVSNSPSGAAVGNVMFCKSKHTLYMAWERTHLGYLCLKDVILNDRCLEIQVRTSGPRSRTPPEPPGAGHSMVPPSFVCVGGCDKRPHSGSSFCRAGQGLEAQRIHLLELPVRNKAWR